MVYTVVPLELPQVSTVLCSTAINHRVIDSRPSHTGTPQPYTLAEQLGVSPAGDLAFAKRRPKRRRDLRHILTSAAEAPNNFIPTLFVQLQLILRITNHNHVQAILQGGMERHH